MFETQNGAVERELTVDVGVLKEKVAFEGVFHFRSRTVGYLCIALCTIIEFKIYKAHINFLKTFLWFQKYFEACSIC